MLSANLEFATLTYTRVETALGIHHWNLITREHNLGDLVGLGDTVAIKVRQVLSSFSKPCPGYALINPGAAPEEVTSLEIPPEIRLEFHDSIDIDAPEANVPRVYIDVTIGGEIRVSLSNEWEPMFSRGGDSWKRSEGYKTIVCGLCQLFTWFS